MTAYDHRAYGKEEDLRHLQQLLKSGIGFLRIGSDIRIRCSLVVLFHPIGPNQTRQYIFDITKLYRKYDLFFRYNEIIMDIMLLRSSYLEKVKPFIGTPVVKVFTGIRRCGKSVLMEQVKECILGSGIASDHTLSLNFESLVDERVRTLESLVSAVMQMPPGKCYLFLDEIQELQGWEKAVNSFLIDKDCDIYITGSNAKILSGELATYLGGRYIEIPVYPFSFKEVLALKETKGDREKHFTTTQLFSSYIAWGGFPFLHNYDLGTDDVRQYLSALSDSIILKDISARHNIRDISLLKVFLSFFICEAGHAFSPSSLEKYMKNLKRKISTETIYNYLDYAQESGLLHLVPRQDLRGKEILKTQGKMYITDHGLREGISGDNLRDIDQVLENITYIELLRRGYGVTTGNNNGKEIDFVAEKTGEKAYFQVCYLLADEKTMQREFGAFDGLHDNWPKTVLSMDAISRSHDGIISRNIIDWLLA